LDNKNQIIVQSSTKNLSYIRNYLENELISLEVNQQITNQIILAVDEACTNIIKHTHKFNDNKYIKLNFEKSGNQFKIIIQYEGNSFDPNSIDNPDMNEYFAKYKVGGLGIPLIKKFMSKIEYNQINPNINSLTLIKDLI
jgi:serine/threonine-protein kinase RsbW